MGPGNEVRLAYSCSSGPGVGTWEEGVGEGGGGGSLESVSYLDTANQTRLGYNGVRVELFFCLHMHVFVTTVLVRLGSQCHLLGRV